MTASVEVDLKARTTSASANVGALLAAPLGKASQWLNYRRPRTCGQRWFQAWTGHYYNSVHVVRHELKGVQDYSREAFCHRVPLALNNFSNPVLVHLRLYDRAENELLVPRAKCEEIRATVRVIVASQPY